MRARAVSRTLLASGALVGALALLVAPSATGQEATPSAFDAVAAADGLRTYFVAPGAPLSPELFDGGAPVTQARVNGTGESVAFASMPYPGDTALSLPGLLLPLLGLPSPPPYPLIARSQSGTTPEASASAGAVELRAKSDERSSEASSSSGGGDDSGTAVGRVLTHAVAKLDAAGAVTSESRALVESFAVSGVLRIGAVDAKANATQPATGGEHRASSTFTAEGVSAGGVAIGVSNDGLLLPGQKAPVPDSSGLSPVLDATGITVRYLAPQEIDGGVVSAGLAVTVPVAQPGKDPVTVTYVLGQVRAIATSSADAAAPVDVLGDDAALGPEVGTDPPLGATPLDPLPASDGALGDGGSSGPLGSAADAAPGAAAGGGGTVGTARPVLARAGATSSASGFYLVLVVGAAVALTGGVLVRVIGVRLAWTS